MVPEPVELNGAVGFDTYTVSSPIRIVGTMKRLVDVSEKMDEQTQISFGTPLVVLPALQPVPILVNLLGHAAASRAVPVDTVSVIIPAKVQEMPSLSLRVQFLQDHV